MDNFKTIVDALTKFSQYYLSGDFLWDLVSTLSRPGKSLMPLEYKTGNSIMIVRDPYDPSRSRLGSKLYSFVVANLLTGTLFYTLQATTSKSRELAHLPELALFGIWFIYGCATFALVTVFRGRGEFWRTISAYMQILSAIFVASNFAVLLWSYIVLVGSNFGLFLNLPGGHSLWRLLVVYPGTLYYFSEFVLAVLYTLPIIKSLYRLDSISRMTASIIPASIYFSFALLIAFSSPITQFVQILERVEEIVPNVFQPVSTATASETPTSQPTVTLSGTPTPQATDTPLATPTNIPWEPTRTRKPRERPTRTLEIPTNTIVPTNTIEPTNPTSTIEPTDSPESTKTPKPTRTPRPTDRPDDDDDDEDDEDNDDKDK